MDLLSPEMQNIVSFLIPAYVAFWLITFLYVFSIRSRQRNLEKDLDALRKIVEKKQGSDFTRGTEAMSAIEVTKIVEKKRGSDRAE